jgi:transcription initiation factor IIE alpha subunit
MNRLDNIDFEPRSKQVDNYKLKLLLSSPHENKFVCLHKWIYWTFGEATKLHRVCEKCKKKQKNRDVIKPSNIWIKDKSIKTNK